MSPYKGREEGGGSKDTEDSEENNPSAGVVEMIEKAPKPKKRAQKKVNASRESGDRPQGASQQGGRN